ncbi:polysaccharide pyruvyl transferase CsaB [Alkalicoccus urumqiensis]|uniref:Polysaccharide pyruvyl transferase CsaB n=1 Tax=Alkalicoccus urumqiensis TaxID=1548213 RepID=A0A2P6MHE2_ALKUR|nr:polysaccharide pyruvyl transferase CsaB [Alkalicoccus urumqiensis]PRO65683.1 polysaccharide pyruvyl transferase CsaB [Alkalicoccus urumqiensis]
MKIVLSGYFGFDNAGDEAILHSMIHAFRDERPDVVITVLSNQPEKTKQSYGVDAVNRWNLKEVIGAVRSADRLISGGGSLLQDKTGPKSVLYYCGVMAIAHVLRTPVTVYAQGIGPLASRASRLLTRQTMKKVDQLTVRDEASRALLREIGVENDIDVVPDPVLGMNPEVIRAAPDADYIAVSVRSWPSGRAHLRKIAGTLDRLLEEGERIVFLPMHGEEDARAASQVLASMKHSGHENVRVLDADAPLEEKQRTAAEAKLVVGMRLHALIFAAAGYTPFTPISYDPKIDAFASLCGQPVPVHVEEDNWESSDLTAAVHEALDQRDTRQRALAAYVTPAKEAVQKLAAAVVS